MSPFDDADISKYIKRRYPFWRFRERKIARTLVRKIPLLAVRPMLLAHIPELVSSKESITFQYELYSVMVKKWLDREQHWVDKHSLYRFSLHLAFEIVNNRKRRGMERISGKELVKMAAQWSIPLQKWQIQGRSLLNRDASGYYKFAHRSILEYLYVANIMNGNKECDGAILTHNMLVLLLEMTLLSTTAVQMALIVFENAKVSIKIASKYSVGKMKAGISHSGLLFQHQVTGLLSTGQDDIHYDNIQRMKIINNLNKHSSIYIESASNNMYRIYLTPDNIQKARIPQINSN